MFAAVQNGLSDFFYKSDATGTTWTNITATVLGGFNSNGPVGMCHVLKDNTTIVLSWIGGPTRKSTDGGTTWTSIPLSITGTRPTAMLSGETSPSWSRGALHQDPLDPNRWYIPNGFGPFRSTDAGATIQYMTKGIGEVVTWKPAWHPNDPQRVYMPMADLIGFVATDGSATGGAQRNPRNSLPLINGNVGMTYSSKTLVGPVVGNASPKVYFIGGASFGNNGGRSCILTTTDDGQTWSLVHVSGITGTGLPATSAIVSGCVAPDDPNEILVSIGGGASGIYRSTNGGVTFTQSTGVPAVGNWGDQFSHFSFLEADTAVPTRRFAWLNGVGFLISSDRGVTWASSGHSVGGPTDNKLLSWNKWGFLARDHATGRLWFGGTAGHLGLAYSTNNGANWTYLNAPNSNTGFSEVRAIDAHNSQVLVCGKRFGDAFLKMYYSDDNGATWTERSKPGYRFPTTTEVALNPHARGQFWIASNGRSYARYALGDAITPEPFVAWQQAQFTPAMLANPAVSGQDADPDGDGQDNAFEFAAGLSPLDPQSRFVQVIENLPPQIGEPQIMSLQFAPLVTGRTYILESSPTLDASANWQPSEIKSTTNNGASRTIVTEIDPMQPQEFFRVRIVGP
jgi:BNR/Asp-box repeat